MCYSLCSAVQDIYIDRKMDNLLQSIPEQSTQVGHQPLTWFWQRIRNIIIFFQKFQNWLCDIQCIFCLLLIYNGLWTSPNFYLKTVLNVNIMDNHRRLVFFHMSLTVHKYKLWNQVPNHDIRVLEESSHENKSKLSVQKWHFCARGNLKYCGICFLYFVCPVLKIRKNI